LSSLRNEQSVRARWRNVNVHGEQEYRNKGLACCPHCGRPLFKGKRVAVIGGGNSGVDAAIDLSGVVGHVTLTGFADPLEVAAILVNKLRSMPNVEIHIGTQTTEISPADGRVDSLVYKDRASGEIHRLPLEEVFVQIGLVPRSAASLLPDWPPERRRGFGAQALTRLRRLSAPPSARPAGRVQLAAW
jgi:alkyl hydroperoxide reductase subunit F